MTFPVPIAIQAGRRVPPIKNVLQRGARDFRDALLAAFQPACIGGRRGPTPLRNLANSDCLDCHTDPRNTRTVNGVKVPLAVFPTNSFQQIRPQHAGLHRLPHRREGTGSRRQPAAAGLLRLPRQGGEGLRDEHSRHEPRDGRVRRGAMLGLPRFARHPAGEGSRIAGLQNEPAADLREVPQQPESHQGIPD